MNLGTQDLRELSLVAPLCRHSSCTAILIHHADRHTQAHSCLTPLAAPCPGHHSCQCVAEARHGFMCHLVRHVCTNRGSFSVDGVYKQPWNRYSNVLVNRSQLTSYLPVDKVLSLFQLMGFNFRLREQSVLYNGCSLLTPTWPAAMHFSQLRALVRVPSMQTLITVTLCCSPYGSDTQASTS